MYYIDGYAVLETLLMNMYVSSEVMVGMCMLNSAETQGMVKGVPNKCIYAEYLATWKSNVICCYKLSKKLLFMFKTLSYKYLIELALIKYSSVKKIQ